MPNPALLVAGFGRRILTSYCGIVGSGCAPHCTSIKTAWNVLAARNLKLTASVGLVGVKVTTTGAVVPGMNAGIVTTALVGVPTTVSDCKPVPALT